VGCAVEGARDAAKVEDLFRGRHTVKMDGKGRVSVPPGFRRALEAADPDRPEGTPATVFIAHVNGEPTLDCMTVREMAILTGKVRRMKRGTVRRRALEEYLFENVEELQLDGTHRITMPRRLRDAAQLGDEIVFGGRGDRFRIYSPEAPTPAVSVLAQELAKLPAGSDPLELLDDDEDDEDFEGAA
jgi:MraZ protein